jgi:hypothetical protein
VQIATGFCNTPSERLRKMPSLLLPILLILPLLDVRTPSSLLQRPLAVFCPQCKW